MSYLTTMSGGPIAHNIVVVIICTYLVVSGASKSLAGHFVGNHDSNVVLATADCVSAARYTSKPKESKWLAVSTLIYISC